MSGTIRRITALLLIAALLPLAGCGLAETVGEVAQPDNPVVRVRLVRLNIADRLDLTLDGQYGLDPGDGTAMTLSRGSEIVVLLREGALVVYYQGMRWEAGDTLTLRRYADTADAGGLRFEPDGNLYEGDLALSVRDGAIRAVLHIRLEDYLLGVVGYEMSDSWPLEALKAQSVAARTYALKRVGRYDDYDVVDTTNDQVFKGRDESLQNVARAIAETRGVCGYYQGKLADCYFGATNGGQTELPENIWGEASGYLKMFDDPYDLANPQSNVRSLELPKRAAKGEVVSLGLRQVLCQLLADELAARGWDNAPESLRVDAVTQAEVDTPMYAAPSRLYTVLRLTLAYSGRTRTDAIPAAATMEPEEDVALFAQATPAPGDTPTPTATVSATPAPTPAPVYGPFTPVEEPVTLEIALFPENGARLGLSHNGDSNELLTVRETADAFFVEARRYGHGVGMSQRGAEWMALVHQKTWLEILAFYYPGLECKRFAGAEAPQATLPAAWAETPGPRPTATPRPTLMPVTLDVPPGAWMAVVTGIDDDSSLNLRAEPDMGGEIVRRLYKNQRLLVLERCEEEGWVKVRTDAAEGYVVERFLTEEE